ILLKDGVIFIRFSNPDIQFNARESLLRDLGREYIIALSLMPATPYWLRILGGEPMKLGLDLRGGVHFLIDIDMKPVLNKLQEQNIDKLRIDLREKKIEYSTIRKIDNYGFKIYLNDNNNFSKVKSYLISNYRNFD
ncbi:MAG: protein translocase subunit SecD, partial [Arsenophonus sp. ET-DL12-MAG3]